MLKITQGGGGDGVRGNHSNDNPFYSNIDSMPDIRPRRKSIPLVSELVSIDLLWEFDIFHPMEHLPFMSISITFSLSLWHIVQSLCRSITSFYFRWRLIHAKNKASKLKSKLRRGSWQEIFQEWHAEEKLDSFVF